MRALVTGVRGDWRGCAPDPRPRVYFANHTSHGDFVLIWTVLPPALRRVTRPVAGADYWTVNGNLRRFIAERVFRAVLIDRDPATRKGDPVEQMADALDASASLILFPEGTRNIDRRAAAAVQERALSILRGAAAGGTGAGVDREPQPGHAEGRIRADPAPVHGHVRRAAARLRRRGQVRIP